MFATLDKKLRRFMYGWLALVGVLVLVAAYTLVGQSNMIQRLGAAQAEELAANPQVQSQIMQMRQQRMTDQQIQERLVRAGEQRAAVLAANARSAAVWAAALALLTTLCLYIIMVLPGADAQMKRLAAYSLLAMLIAQLIFVAMKYVQVEDVSQTLGEPEVVQKLKSVAAPFRIAVLDQRHPVYNMWITTLFGLHGLECMNVPADSRPTPDRTAFFYTEALTPARRWQYGNVRFVLGTREMLEMALRQLGVRRQFVPWYAYSLYNENHAVYEFTNVLPRVFAVGTWTVSTNAEATLALMNNPSNDPHHVAVVNDTTLAARTDADFHGTVGITNYVAERVCAQVDLSSTGLVVMATEPAAGWQATVDGAPAALLRCNLLHQGVLVPPGQHAVVFQYVTHNWQTQWTNWTLMAVPVLAVATLVLWLVRKRRRDR
ncbi:MAG: hypothetical protein NTV22_16335 [bacterium]|nr:hypothetical protein [bacterium]